MAQLLIYIFLTLKNGDFKHYIRLIQLLPNLVQIIWSRECLNVRIFCFLFGKGKYLQSFLNLIRNLETQKIRLCLI